VYEFRCIWNTDRSLFLHVLLTHGTGNLLEHKYGEWGIVIPKRKILRMPLALSR
jgi:hypothetical protein